ncbi:MAG: hypothetical protein IPJ77_04090 [Planctomycetes bacterium]|nr:hypothetical protein [Planctomycetota bacterium]
MALRILTGIITVGPPRGEATIRFEPHGLASADSTATTVSELKAIGGSGRFTATPAKFVALRELGIQTFNVNAVFGLADNFSEALKVGDSITRDELRITWDAAADLSKPFIRVLPREISYMVIGNVPD